MIERRMLGWLSGLVAVVVVTAAAAVASMWIAVELQVQVDAFYTSQTGTDPVSEETYRYWSKLSENAYTLQQYGIPLLVASAIGLFTLLAILARRWDVSRGRAVPADEDAYETEAPAAS
jgi:hypothetical protein